MRRLAEIEPRVVDERERAADELDRHQPVVAPSPRLAPSIVEGSGRQRDEPAGKRRERLIRRQDDRFSFVRNGDRAERVLTDRQLKDRGQLIQRHEFLGADEGHLDWAAAFFGEQRQRRGRRNALTGETGEETANGEREKGERTERQWRISD